MTCTAYNRKVSKSHSCTKKQKIFTPGTCFSTRGALTRPEIPGIGEGDSFTITTMHDPGMTFDEKFAHASIFENAGLNFAVVDDHITVPAAVLTKSRSIDAGEAEGL